MQERTLFTWYTRKSKIVIKAKTRARESHRPVTPISNNIFFFATILPKQTLRGPKSYVQGPSKHFVYALRAHVRMCSHVTTKRKNSMLSAWFWLKEYFSRNWQPFYSNFEQKCPKFKGERGRLPVFYPHPHGCSPLSILSTDHISGGNPCERGLKQISAKSGEGFISQKQQEQGNIQKFSSSDQRTCLSTGKSCLVEINDCVPFTLSSAYFAREICAIARSLMEFVQAEVRHILFSWTLACEQALCLGKNS